MNSCGLVMCTNAIDNGERQLFGGVPRTFLARKLLTCRTLPEAMELLNSVPRSIPLLYMLSQPGYGTVVVESCPSRLEIREHQIAAEDTVITHGNVMQWLVPASADCKSDALKSSLQDQVAQEGQMTCENALSALATKPVFVPGGTLEMFACDPQMLSMRVRFMTDTISGGGIDFQASEDLGSDLTFSCASTASQANP